MEIEIDIIKNFHVKLTLNKFLSINVLTWPKTKRKIIKMMVLLLITNQENRANEKKLKEESFLLMFM